MGNWKMENDFILLLTSSLDYDDLLVKIAAQLLNHVF